MSKTNIQQKIEALGKFAKILIVKRHQNIVLKVLDNQTKKKKKNGIATKIKILTNKVFYSLFYPVGYIWKQYKETEKGKTHKCFKVVQLTQWREFKSAAQVSLKSLKKDNGDLVF